MDEKQLIQSGESGWDTQVEDIVSFISERGEESNRLPLRFAGPVGKAEVGFIRWPKGVWCGSWFLYAQTQ
jgi:hypothetical protein